MRSYLEVLILDWDMLHAVFVDSKRNLRLARLLQHACRAQIPSDIFLVELDHSPAISHGGIVVAELVIAGGAVVVQAERGRRVDCIVEGLQSFGELFELIISTAELLILLRRQWTGHGGVGCLRLGSGSVMFGDAGGGLTHRVRACACDCYGMTSTTTS